MDLKSIKRFVELELNGNIQIRTRKRHYVYCRSVYFALCRKYTTMSLREIGETVGRDHATVIHGINIFNDQIKMYNEKRYLDVYYKISDIIESEKVKTEPEEYYKTRVDDLQSRLSILERINNMLESKIKNHDI